jgi:hypothetical protein
LASSPGCRPARVNVRGYLGRVSVLIGVGVYAPPRSFTRTRATSTRSLASACPVETVRPHWSPPSIPSRAGRRRSGVEGACPSSMPPPACPAVTAPVCGHGAEDEDSPPPRPDCGAARWGCAVGCPLHTFPPAPADGAHHRDRPRLHPGQSVRGGLDGPDPPADGPDRHPRAGLPDHPHRPGAGARRRRSAAQGARPGIRDPRAGILRHSAGPPDALPRAPGHRRTSPVDAEPGGLHGGGGPLPRLPAAAAGAASASVEAPPARAGVAPARSARADPARRAPAAAAGGVSAGRNGELP